MPVYPWGGYRGYGTYGGGHRCRKNHGATAIARRWDDGGPMGSHYGGYEDMRPLVGASILLATLIARVAGVP